MTPLTPFDIELADLLRAWAPAIGRPACAAGCDRCCRRMTVLMTSAEALRLVDHLRARPDWEALRDTIRAKCAQLRKSLPAPPDRALNALLDLGPCVFLEGGNCGVYAARPDGCRAAHVWHDSWYCGRPEYDQCVPAELHRARAREAFRLTLSEMEAGRRPYWGHILPAVWLMLERDEEYLCGNDLSAGLDPAWIASDLIEFPTREQVLREQFEIETAFQREDYPFGAPRASECSSREDLRAFRID